MERLTEGLNKLNTSEDQDIENKQDLNVLENLENTVVKPELDAVKNEESEDSEESDEEITELDSVKNEKCEESDESDDRDEGKKALLAFDALLDELVELEPYKEYFKRYNVTTVVPLRMLYRLTKKINDNNVTIFVEFLRAEFFVSKEDGLKCFECIRNDEDYNSFDGSESGELDTFVALRCEDGEEKEWFKEGAINPGKWTEQLRNALLLMLRIEKSEVNTASPLAFNAMICDILDLTKDDDKKVDDKLRDDYGIKTVVPFRLLYRLLKKNVATESVLGIKEGFIKCLTDCFGLSKEYSEHFFQRIKHDEEHNTFTGLIDSDQLDRFVTFCCNNEEQQDDDQENAINYEKWTDEIWESLVFILEACDVPQIFALREGTRSKFAKMVGEVLYYKDIRGVGEIFSVRLAARYPTPRALCMALIKLNEEKCKEFIQRILRDGPAGPERPHWRMVYNAMRQYRIVISE